jgi:RimJ/RimL family protein N-acetyltransferase
MPFLLGPVIPAGVLSASPQPELKTGDGELVLRPPLDSDAAAVFEAFQDPVLRHWHARSMESVDEAHAWIDGVRRDWDAEKGAQWIIARAVDGVPLGRMALRTMVPAEGIAEIGYWVTARARGLGAAPRALTALTDWALAVGFHRIDLRHSTGNAASCRVAEKAGYPLEGVQRSSTLHTDGWHDMHVHVRIAEEAPRQR